MSIWRKFKKFIKICPLVVLLIVTTVGFSLYAFVMCQQGEYELKISMEHPIFAAVMNQEYATSAEQDEEKPVESDIAEDAIAKEEEGTEQKASDDAVRNEEMTTEEVTTEETTEAPFVAYTNSDADAFWNTLPVCETTFEKGKKRKAKSKYYSANNLIAKTTSYNYRTVDNSYFDDALFIGDSRVEGLKCYSTLQNATFYSEEGLTVYTMLKEKIAKVGKKKMTIPQALKKQSFKKIYIMVGINELGTGTTDDYQNQYKKDISTICQLQPNAVIFITSVMKMTAKKAGKDPVYNNDNIEDKNVAAAQLANGVNIFYFDINPILMDEKQAGIVESYTWDGVHLKAEYYEIWEDFLRRHGLGDERFRPVEQNGE